MPELPEVETVVSQLKPDLEGKNIKLLKIYDRKRLPIRPSRFKKRAINKVFRKGKYIVLELEESDFLAVHLRMTGRLKWISKNSICPPGKHTRADFYLDDESLLRFSDVRRFGTIEEYQAIDEIGPPGVEPLSREFNSGTFFKLILKSKQPIKTFLLRQDKILGLGNIYVSEILYKSGVLPTRLTSNLNKDEAQKIVKNTKKVLKKAILNCGTTFSDFQQATGEIGNYQRFLKVYGRKGEKCLNCSSQIVKITQAGRSSFYCNNCQI